MKPNSLYIITILYQLSKMIKDNKHKVLTLYINEINI